MGRVWAGRSGAVRNFECVDFELPAENPGKGELGMATKLALGKMSWCQCRIC